MAAEPTNLLTLHGDGEHWAPCVSAICADTAERRILLVSVPGWGSHRLAINVVSCRRCGALHEEPPPDAEPPPEPDPETP